jgi:F0F1-type ATP synthase epsilon subunit
MSAASETLFNSPQTLELTLLTPTSSRTVNATLLEIETLMGNLVIQPGYAPSYIVLKPGSTVSWTLPNETTITLKVVRGFLEVQRTKAVLIFEGEPS